LRKAAAGLFAVPVRNSILSTRSAPAWSGSSTSHAWTIASASSRLAGTDCTWLVVRVRMNGELLAVLVGVALGVGFVLALLVVIGAL
jgi:hypothetical protein